MISVIATVVFFILLLHAFIKNEPANSSNYPNFYADNIDSRVIIIPARLKNKILDRDSIKSFGFLFFLISNDTLLGMPTMNQKLFQMPVTPIMEGIIDLHHDIMFFLIFIIIFVLYILASIIALFSDNNSSRNTETFAHNTTIETI
jgi:hypothetical protein